MGLKSGRAGMAGSIQNIVLAIILTVVLLGTAAVVYYFITMPREGEAFTEFYILPPEGMEQGYPTRFVMQGDGVVSVTYGSGGQEVAGESGRVILGVVNHEYEESTYLIKVVIDGEPVDISFDGAVVDVLGPVVLAHEEKWEHEIGFSPRHVGDAQKVEFVLYKDGVPCFEEPLYLWIDVEEQG